MHAGERRRRNQYLKKGRANQHRQPLMQQALKRQLLDECPHWIQGQEKQDV